MEDVPYELILLYEAIMFSIDFSNKDVQQHVASLNPHIAQVVKSLAGGEILKSSYEGKDYFWNKLEDGVEIDMAVRIESYSGFKPLVDKGEVYIPKNYSLLTHRLIRDTRRYLTSKNMSDQKINE